uniref:CRAL-TRIO domain-containing protein n=2 Tax=Rhodnius TaxID=13248 RepID=T1HM77_RHOPR
MKSPFETFGFYAINDHLKTKMTESALNENWWKIKKEEEYKKNKNLNRSDVNTVQEWIKKQPHLPQLNDNQIIMFLRACNYSLEQTKMSINLNYTMRTKLPEFFSQRDLQRKQTETVLEYLQLASLRKPEDDDIIIYSYCKEIDLAKFNADELIKLFLMFHDMTQMEYGSCSGYTYLIDLKNVTIKILLRLPISAVGNLLKFWQDCSTYTIKQIHIINGGHVYKTILQIVQQFFDSEFLNKIQLHENYESLKKSLNINDIPEEYEGKGKSIAKLNEETMGVFKQYNEWFKAEETQRIDEKKKMFKKSIDDDLQGSFRKLDID